MFNNRSIALWAIIIFAPSIYFGWGIFQDLKEKKAQNGVLESVCAIGFPTDSYYHNQYKPDTFKRVTRRGGPPDGRGPLDLYWLLCKDRGFKHSIVLDLEDVGIGGVRNPYDSLNLDRYIVILTNHREVLTSLKENPVLTNIDSHNFSSNDRALVHHAKYNNLINSYAEWIDQAEKVTMYFYAIKEKYSNLKRESYQDITVSEITCRDLMVNHDTDNEYRSPFYKVSNSMGLITRLDSGWAQRRKQFAIAEGTYGGLWTSTRLKLITSSDWNIARYECEILGYITEYVKKDVIALMLEIEPRSVDIIDLESIKKQIDYDRKIQVKN